MLKIMEVQHQVDDVANYQARVSKWESFEDYHKALRIGDTSLPTNAEITTFKVNVSDQELYMTFYWPSFNITMYHFAKVVDE